MTFVALLPAIFGCLLLGAHFSRANLTVPMVLCAALTLLLLIPRKWAARAVQIGLVVGTVEWLRTLFLLVQQRAAMGEPWTRLAVILGAVVLFTALAALSFESERLRRRYAF